MRDDDALNVKQVAHLLGCSEWWVYQHLDRLPAYRLGPKLIRFRREDIEAYRVKCAVSREQA